MFIGEHVHSVDIKGRVSIPAKYREQLKEGVVVTRGLDHCLWIYTNDEWKKIAGKIAALPISQKKSRAFARLMLAGAWDAEVDAQGRILIPEYLRKFAGLQKQVVFAGLYSRVEIWDEDEWYKYRNQTEKASEKIAEDMLELGI